MRHLLHKIVTKKTERLRACLLLALLITAGGLALGGKETPPTPAAPAGSTQYMHVRSGTVIRSS